MRKVDDDDDHGLLEKGWFELLLGFGEGGCFCGGLGCLGLIGLYGGRCVGIERLDISKLVHGDAF